MIQDDRKETKTDASESGDAEQIVGIAEAFRQALELGTQTLQVQSLLFEGIADSQQKELKRLSALHGAEDARTTAASERLERFGSARDEFKQRADIGATLSKTFVGEGIFHGYVYRADSKPAKDHTVRLELHAARWKRCGALSAKTNDEGYFRLEFRQHRQDDAEATAHWAERVVATATEQNQAAPVDASRAGSVKGGTSEPHAHVSILDQCGSVVFIDPDPPPFKDDASVFRYYSLTGTSDTAQRG